MGVFLWCASVPLVLYIVRKVREYSWGYCNDWRPLKNKVFIVTGASSGLGKETVKGLALRGARVVMACRDLEKAKRVIVEIREDIQTGELIPMELELGSMKSIEAFVNEIKTSFPKVDVLINNGGVSVPPSYHMKTEEGFELNMGVNYIGHFVLTEQLLKTDSSPQRIVNVISTLLEGGVIDFDTWRGDKEFPTGKRNPAYNNSKLALMYYTRSLEARFRTSSIGTQKKEVYAVCPGFCYTDLFRFSKLKWFQYIMFLPIAFLFMRSARSGCQTILHCALSDGIAEWSGHAFRDCHVHTLNYKFSDTMQKKLLDETKKRVALVSPKEELVSPQKL